jgi:hypothetical protein
VTNYPHAVYSAGAGGFLVAWGAASGALETAFVALDVSAVPGPADPNPIPGGGGGGAGPGGSVPGGASSLTVTPAVKFSRDRRAIYPHVAGITDQPTHDSVKLLWDKVHSLTEEITTFRSAQTTQVAALETRAAAIEQDITHLKTTPPPVEMPEALATNVPGAGSGGSGGGVPGGGSGGDPGGGPTPTVPLPNLAHVVVAYAAANPAQLTNSCQNTGGTWDFMNGVVAALRAVDPRFGFNGKRGNVNDPSQDAVSYYFGSGQPTEGSPEVYVVDVISGHCGANPQPTWIDVTDLSPSGAGAAWTSRGQF